MDRTPIGHYELTSTHHRSRKHWTGSNRDKYEAAEEAIAVFKRAGKHACVFGSLAFKLFGVFCKPNDVDIIVLGTRKSPPELQEYLVEKHPHGRFYIMPSRFRQAKHRVLWYATHRGARVKVDILKPGVMKIPRFQPTLITQVAPPGRAGLEFDLPVAPLELVLLLKLGGWVIHYESPKPHLRKKRHEDVKQLRSLLIMYKRQFDFDYLPKGFINTAKRWVRKYVAEYPSSIGSWRLLGLYH